MYLFLTILIFIVTSFIYGQDELFEKYDKDNNDRLNPIEFNKLLNEKMKAISGNKGKNAKDNEFVDSMPNLEIFKGIDTNNDGEIDEDEFEAQRELFDFISRMPFMDELTGGDENNEELDEKAIVDRLAEESVKEMESEKMKEENLNKQSNLNQNKNIGENNLVNKKLDKGNNKNDENKKDKNTSSSDSNLNEADKCSKEDGKCNTEEEEKENDFKENKNEFLEEEEKEKLEL